MDYLIPIPSCHNLVFAAKFHILDVNSFGKIQINLYKKLCSWWQIRKCFSFVYTSYKVICNFVFRIVTIVVEITKYSYFLRYYSIAVCKSRLDMQSMRYLFHRIVDFGILSWFNSCLNILEISFVVPVCVL